jgi:Domain of unknown function (DUF4424)
VTRIVTLTKDLRRISGGCAMRQFVVIMVFILALVAARTAEANDSSAELALGGLRLLRSDSISMDSEELFISTERIRVSYRFTNRTAADIETQVVFPLPDISLSEAPGDSPFDGDYIHDLDFSTIVDGVPVPLSHSRTAMLDGRDVTALLARHGLPPMMAETALAERLHGLDHAARQDLIRQGLIEASGAELRPDWRPRWSIRTLVGRTQTFPAGRTVAVEHSYRPITGSSVSGALERNYRVRLLRLGGEGHFLFARFCIGNAWLNRFDRGGDRRRAASGAYRYDERYVGYVLRTGANWRGPIGRFRLVVQQAQPHDLIATCTKGLRRVSPTRWELVRRDFKPSEDLSILFIRWR